MLLKDYQYEHALDVPFDDWSKFDRDKDEIIESLEYRFVKKSGKDLQNRRCELEFVRRTRGSRNQG